MSAANDEHLEMIDYAVDMLSGELPLIEQEYGWSESLQADILARLGALGKSLEAGSPAGNPGLLAVLDDAGVQEGTLREFCGMIESAVT